MYDLDGARRRNAVEIKVKKLKTNTGEVRGEMIVEFLVIDWV